MQVVIAESHVITHTLYPEEMEFTHAGSMETAAVLAYDAALVHLENATEPSERGPPRRHTGCSAAPTSTRCCGTSPDRRHRLVRAAGTGHPARAEQIAEAVADHVVARAARSGRRSGRGGGGPGGGSG